MAGTFGDFSDSEGEYGSRQLEVKRAGRPTNVAGGETPSGHTQRRKVSPQSARTLVCLSRSNRVRATGFPCANSVVGYCGFAARCRCFPVVGMARRMALPSPRVAPRPAVVDRRCTVSEVLDAPRGARRTRRTSSMLVRINREDEDMPKGDVETYHQDGTWKNKVEGDDSAESTHDTKDEAIQAGRDMARSRKVEHIIKNMDGTIAERNSYGHDPRNVPG
jgi:hypothetical protein